MLSVQRDGPPPPFTHSIRCSRSCRPLAGGRPVSTTSGRHGRRVASIAAAALLALVLASAARAAVIGVGASADGKTLRAHVGDRIVVTLKANASTGYAWVPAAAGAPVLRLDAARYLPASSTGLVGAPGRYVARFTVRAAGRARIVLVYVRHTRPKTPPAGRFSLTIVAAER